MGNWKIIVNGSTKDFADDYGFIVQQQPGTGMAPVKNNSTSYGLLDGEVFNKTKTQTKKFTLIGTFTGNSTSDLHSKRAQLIKALNPHRTASQSPVEVQYIIGSSTFQASTYYQFGLELKEVNVSIEHQVPIHFEMFDPYVEAPTATSAILNTNATLFVDSLIHESSAGGWENVPNGPSLPDATTYQLVVDNQTNILYAAGEFDGNYGGSDLQGTQNIVTYDGASLGYLWTSGCGLDFSAWSVGLGPNYVLAGGRFEAAGTVTTASYIAKYQSGTWSDLDGGVSGTQLTPEGIDNDGVHAIAVDGDGYIYVGGQFGYMGTAFETASGIARFDGTSWDDVGASTNDHVAVLVYSVAENRIWAGGNFTQIGGNTASYLAYYDISSSTWTAFGKFNDMVEAIAIGPNQEIYVGGDFTRIGTETAASRFAIYDGSWRQGGDGLNGKVHDIVLDDDGLVHLTGAFTQTGTRAIPRYATFDGFTINPGDISPPGFMRFAIRDGKKHLMNAFVAGSIPVSDVTTINNFGTANAYPIFSASGTGVVHSIKNNSTGATIYFDGLSLLDGEKITLDLSPGKKTFQSTLRGNILSFISKGSQVGRFFLMPGDNEIIYFADGATVESEIEFKARYWSFDGAA